LENFRGQFFFTLLALLLLAPLAFAQNSSRSPGNATFSRSGQFVIYPMEPGALRRFNPPLTNHTLVRLDANLLAISCERIKSALLSQLASPDQWHGKIHLALHPPQTANDDITVTSAPFADGWMFRIELPDLIEPERLVRAITQTLLAEMATRTGRAAPGQFPAWIADGLPQLLLADTEIELVLNSESSAAEKNSFGENSTHRFKDAVTLAREKLAGQKPLPLAQLGQWPEEMEGVAAQRFQGSELLLLHELLALKGGGPALAAALNEMAADPDWRVGLVRAFKAHFHRIVDLEKWWALQSAYVSSRTPTQTWSPTETLNKLDVLLRCSLEIQVSSNEPALHTDAALQTIIRSWEFPQQEAMFREKIKLFDAVKLRAPKDLAGLISQYRTVLDTYLKRLGSTENSTVKHEAFGHFTAGKPPKASGVPDPELAAVKDALLQLDVLDKRRDAWRANLAAPEKLP
jgi:hypothetical protein